ncbi:SwmB domain-containing protein [Acinetobacter variabilis]|uniref:SwmB domain-containing protein n=1 Tax=Acinetobacter variabilis TaxID=70346 RepID=UPI003A899F71
MANIQILSAENGELIQDINTNIVNLTEKSVIKVNATIDEVAKITRQGNSAVIYFKNGETITIENYFDYAVNDNRIVFEHEGQLYWAEFTDENGVMLDTIRYHPLTGDLAESGTVAAGVLPWLGGALALGAIAAAAGGGSSSGSSSDNRDTSPPKLTGVIVNEEGQLELSFDENINGSNPRAEDFTVVVDGEEIPVTDIIVQDDKIILITEPEIRDGQEVTVEYQDSTPDDNQGIKDSEGNVLEDLDSDDVGGVQNPDISGPVLLAAEVNANGNIELSFNEALDADNLPPLDSLVVTVGTAPDQTTVDVINIVADGNTLTLITSPVIAAGQTVSVKYTDPTAGNDENAIQDLAGNDAASFSTVDLPNGVINDSEQPVVDTASPVLIDAEVNADGNIELSFNEDVSTSNPLPADFTVIVDGSEVPVTDIVYDGNEIILITDPVITEGQEVAVTYADSTSGDGQGIRDGSGNVLDGFDAVEVGGVDNNSEQPAEDTVAPVLIDAEVNADGNIELSFNEDVSTSNPLPADFTVVVDGAEIPVTDIVYDGNKIILVTDPVITEGQEVEVTYADSTSGDGQGIRDGSGNVLDGFDAVEVGGIENNSEQPVEDTVAPVLIGAEVNADGNIELSFNEDVSTSNPLSADFTVVVDGTEIPVTDIVYGGNEIILVTDPVITEGQEIEVTYADSTPGDGQGIRDGSGNVLDGFDAAEVGGVENNSEQPIEDTVAPVLIEAEVNADGNIELSFNEDVSTSNPLPADFTVIVDGSEVPVTDIVYDGNEIILVTNPVITEGQEVAVTYADSTPGEGQGIRDVSGNVLDGFDAVEVGGVDNNSEQPVEDTVAPVLIDAEVNADGNIELSFNETLDADNLPPLDSLVVTIGTAPDQTTVDVINIAADGNILTMITNPVITAGQTVSVEYTDPTTGNDDNAIQDLAGNDAASFTTADLPNGVVNNSERLLNLADDNVSAILEGSQDATVLETYSDSSGIDVLNGTSEVAVVDFTIEENISSVVIAVQQENLVSLANAFTFVVRNTTTGEEFEVASANTSQGGLVAGALGLELLGGVADAQGLRLDINDLPAGTYEVSVYGDSSQLADILTTIDLANLGDNTVNNLVSETVLGLLEATLTGQNADPRGILEQLTLRELLDLTTGSSVPIINTLTTAVDSVLSLALDNILVRPILGDVYNTSVGSLLAGNGGGALGFLLTTLGLGTALDALLNGILEGVDGAGQALFDNLVEPLVSDILLNTVLEETGLTTGLNTLLGSLNTLLSTLGLDDVLPAVDGLIDLIAQEALSNPLTLFGGTTAEVYEVNGEIYRATGNIQETSADGTQADNWAGGVLTEINGQPVTFDLSDEGGNFTLIEGTYGELKLYENGNFSYEYNSSLGQGPLLSEVFEYTVTRNAGQADQESASANLVINIDRVNQIINYADDPAENLLQGGAGDDILTGGAGADTAIYYLLNNADATGGNGTDTWTDFNAVEGDTIDVSALLSDQAVDASNLGNYITLEQRGDDTVVTIDRDGSDTNTTFARADLLILQNVDSATLQLDDIIKYNPI